MNKIIIGVLVGLTFLSAVALAQTSDLPDPGVLPNNPFYFLKRWSEDIGTFFTFGETAKIERFLKLSEKRLAEAKALATKGITGAAEKAIERYQEQAGRALIKAEEAKIKGFNVDEILVRVSEITLKHQMVLTEVYEKVPEQARSAIEQAMQAGMRSHEEALKAVSGEKREQIKQNIEEKMQIIDQKFEELKIFGRSRILESEDELEEIKEVKIEEKEAKETRERMPDLPRQIPAGKP